MYHPSLIHSYLSHLNSKSRTVCCILLSRHKAITHWCYKSIQDIQEPQEPSRTKDKTCCPRPRYLDPSTIKGNLGCCKRGVLVVEYCPTEEQVADVLTKGLSKEKHEKFTSMMGLKDE